MITEAKEHLEVARLYIRITKDLKQITLKKMIFLNEYIESISKQLTGWEKAVIQSNAGVAPVKAGASVPYQSNSPPRLGGGKLFIDLKHEKMKCKAAIFTTALPGGYFSDWNNTFNYISSYACFWSSTEVSSMSAWNLYLRNNSNSVIKNNTYMKALGFSVRCLKD
jgi:hypothetical protein